ncbi:MAG: nitroreductase family protein [Deltaproteobacteria bacterium]|nr:nitroreductase family protein [Deltaproteobacteria bacterium]
MSWVEIDRTLCNQCDICVTRCPRCFSHTDDGIRVDAHIETCNLCGHCVSLCPQDAITHQKMDMRGFKSAKKKITFEADQFIEFIKQRRSHRHFTNKKIPRADLETLIDTCRYAPTGSNVQTVEILVVQDPERIKTLSDLTVDYFQVMMEKAEKSVERLMAEGKEIPGELQLVYSRAEYRKRLMTARDAGLDPIFHRAPVVVIFHSPALTSTPKDNCVIAAHTMALTARTMGLETCYIGLFEGAAMTSKLIRGNLNLPTGHNVYSVLIMGYPRLKFRKTVDRLPIKTRWE